MVNEDLKNNLSTIVLLVTGALSPFVAQYVTHEQFSALVIAIVDVIFILYSAKHPNTFKALGNEKCDDGACDGETVLNDEYEVDLTGDGS